MITGAFFYPFKEMGLYILVRQPEKGELVESALDRKIHHNIETSESNTCFAKYRYEISEFDQAFLLKFENVNTRVGQRLV